MKTKTPCIGTNLCTALTTLCIDKQRQICFLPFFKNCRSSLLIIWLSTLIVRIILSPRQTTKTKNVSTQQQQPFLGPACQLYVAYSIYWLLTNYRGTLRVLISCNVKFAAISGPICWSAVYWKHNIQRNKKNAHLHERVSPFHNSRHNAWRWCFSCIGSVQRKMVFTLCLF